MCFDKLRKRYNKKKNDAKKAKKSGSSTRESEKAERALEAYKFFFWLDKFIYIREGRSNVPRDNSFSNEDEDKNDGYASNEYFSDENKSDDEEKEGHFENSRATSVISPTNSRASSIISPTLPSKKNTTSSKRKVDTSNQAANNKKGKGSKNENLDEMELNVLRDLGKTIKDDPKELDGIDMYVRSLAADLRKLSERDYFMVKHEIQGVLFKYQMAQFRQNQGGSIVGGSSANTETNFMNNNDGFYSRWINNSN